MRVNQEKGVKIKEVRGKQEVWGKGMRENQGENAGKIGEKDGTNAGKGRENAGKGRDNAGNGRENAEKRGGKEGKFRGNYGLKIGDDLFLIKDLGEFMDA